MKKRALVWHRRVSGADAVDHLDSAPSQTTPTLCGWEGGRQSTDDAVLARTDVPKCHDCTAIARWAGRLP